MALRYRKWKIAFLEQNHKISPELPQGPWMGQFTKLRNLAVNLAADPFERGPESGNYLDWYNHRIFILVPAQAAVAKYIESFKDFPPRTKPASFTVGEFRVMSALPQKRTCAVHSSCLLWAKSGHWPSSIDHLVGAREHCRGDSRGQAPSRS